MKKLIILDRDGVINYDSENYIKSPDEWLPIPGSLEAMGILTKAGYIITLATNQSGISRGLFTREILTAIHDKMRENAAKFGGKIDSIFYCPHQPNDNCECRKPKPGLLKAIAAHYQIDLCAIPFVGDSWRDVEAAMAVNCKPILVKTGANTVALEKYAACFPAMKIYESLKDYVLKEI